MIPADAIDYFVHPTRYDTRNTVADLAGTGISCPPFPSYVSGHSTTSGAASTVLATRFPSDGRQLRAQAEEAAVSRLYGGIHFRSDNEAGLALGRRVGRAAVDRYDLRRG